MSPSLPAHHLFASCNNPLLYLTNTTTTWETVWPAIKSYSTAFPASSFVWGGDAVYGDSVAVDPLSGKLKRTCADEAKLRTLYDLMLDQTVMNNLYPPDVNGLILGTLDDHDMGCNNAGSSNPLAISGMAGYEYKRFLDKSKEILFTKAAAAATASSPSPKAGKWDRPDQMDFYKNRKAAYGVTVFDHGAGEIFHEDPNSPPLQAFPGSSSKSNDKIAIFALDCRTHKTPWPSTPYFSQWQVPLLTSLGLHPPTYPTDLRNADFFGEDQWEWFEHMLSSSDAALNIIVQGLQVLPDFRVRNGNMAET